MKYYERIEKFREKFYNEKMYLEIEKIINKDINNDDYKEDTEWTDNVDEMFSFLFDYAFDIMPFEEEVNIRHNDEYINLFEMHGQGCFRSISTLDEIPDEYVNFSDIVRFYETKEKPFKSHVLEVVNKSLDVLEIAMEGIDGASTDIDKIREYVINNLN